MKTPKMAGPSAEETELTRLQVEQLRKKEADVATEEGATKQTTERAERAAQAGRVGTRSLLSGDWGGFRRGGDLGGS